MIIAVIEQKTAKVCALEAFYCTPDKFEYAFLTFIGVDNLFKQNGFASMLINEMIKFCLKKKMKGIDTQTWDTNVASISLFLKHGFKIVNKVNNRKSDIRSVLLRLQYD